MELFSFVGRQEQPNMSMTYTAFYIDWKNYSSKICVSSMRHVANTYPCPNGFVKNIPAWFIMKPNNYNPKTNASVLKFIGPRMVAAPLKRSKVANRC
jgi:hypothetical protein